jgi:hypothetical protein
MECVSEPDPTGWGYTTIEQVRVWIREQLPEGSIIRWELHRQDNTTAKNWYLFDEGITTFKNIYLFPFYTNRCGFMAGLPPFQNIAESTLEHWQWKSEHGHALSMCCFGMYTASGVPEDFAYQIGPGKTHTCTAPDATFGVLETSGVGVTLTETTLKNIEARIESAGVNLRVERSGGAVTATAAALDSEDTNSALKAVAGGFSDSIEQMFMAFAEIMGLDPNKAGEAECNDDFGSKKGSDAGLQELGKLRALGDISRPQIIAEYKRRGELSEDFDIDVNEEELSSETPPMAGIGIDNSGAAV